MTWRELGRYAAVLVIVAGLWTTYVLWLAGQQAPPACPGHPGCEMTERTP